MSVVQTDLKHTQQSSCLSPSCAGIAGRVYFESRVDKPDMVDEAEKECLSYFFIAVLKYHDQCTVQKEGLIWANSAGGLESRLAD